VALDRAEPEPPAALVAAVAAGDVDALARVMALHDGSMRRICMVVTGNTALVDDAVQAAWVRAWRSMRGLRDPTRLRPWLMSIAANEARHLLRSAYRRSDHERTWQLAEPADPALRGELLDLAAALERLGPDDRRLIALRHLAGLSSEEIARELGGSPASVRGRIARALARLRKDMDR
jgi:RNA polymerase sigma-70 factor (ECF subfamily)